MTSILEGLDTLRATIRKTIWHKQTRVDMLRGMDLCIEFVEAHADAPLRKPEAAPSKMDELLPPSKLDTPPRITVERAGPVEIMPLTGMEIIGEMTRDQLTAEIMHFWLRKLNKNEEVELRQTVVRMRSQQVQRRLMQEANLHPRSGGNPFGRMFGYGDDDDEF